MRPVEAAIREAKRCLLSLIHHIESRSQQRRVNQILGHYSAAVITNQEPEQKKSVLFIVTRMVRFHGGQTSLLRLGTELAKLGYDVGYAVYKPQSLEEMQLCAGSNLQSFQGTLYPSSELKQMLQGKKKAADIIIASSWDTVAFAKRLPGYRMYFVQDFEPYFYSFGELYLLAAKTYEQGLHMVSLGAWNRRMIERECHPVSPIDVIDFPYERSEYQYKKRDFLSYAKKKEITLAVYLKFYGKRLPSILPYLLTNAGDYLQKRGIVLRVNYFGEAKSFHAPGGKNMGMLNKQELCELYHRADFGMVASMSNISLVPYEMLAAGLPVIEFADGTFGDFFPEGSATLIGFSYQELAEKLLELLRRPEQLQLQLDKAHSYMRELGWAKSAAQFSEIIQGL